MSRRRLLQGAAGGALGIGALGLLAGCENTTTAIGACEGDGSSNLVVAKPTGPGGLPLPRPDNAVTWAITADNQPIADGVPDEKGPLGIYNYADYIDPGVVKKFEKLSGRKVQIATYNSADEAVAKLAAGAVAFDVIIGLTGANIVNLIAQQLIQPLNHSYLPNFEQNVWPELQDPFYDRASRYTVPYTVWSDGIGWRNDKIDTDIAGMKVPWDIFWESQPYKGKVGILDDKRDALAMPMQRDAMRTGRRPDLNTEDQTIVAQAGKDLGQLTDIANVKVTINGLPDPPRGQDVAQPGVVERHAQRRVLLHAEGRAADRPLLLEPRLERRRPERLLLHRPHLEEPGPRAPVRQLHVGGEDRLREHGRLRRLRRRRRTASPPSR